jgi:Tol biopolymer transport system component
VAIPLSVASACTLCCLTPIAAAWQSTTSRVNLDSAGNAALGGGSYRSEVSADGRYVVFTSDATNLVAGDTNGAPDIFVRDVTSGATARVSVSSSGAQADGDSAAPSLSADGRFVVFASDATNLVAGDTNGKRDIFVRDLTTGQTTRASVGTNSVQSEDRSVNGTISGDGRYVAFETRAMLSVGDSNGINDVYLRDRQTDQTTLLSGPLNGSPNDGGSYDPDITPDGRFVAYWSWDVTVVADANPETDIYVYDALTGQTTIASVDSSGAQVYGSHCFGASISDDGRYVAFASDGSTFVAGDAPYTWDYFVHDRVSGANARVSVDSQGVAANDFLWDAPPAISGDGRFVAFASTASNLVVGDTNGAADVFLHDRLFGLTSLLSANSAGLAGNAVSHRPALSRDGYVAVFNSKATDLIAGDVNGLEDVFRVDGSASAPQTYCTAGVTFNGCQAQIAASANPSVSGASSCAITVVDVEGQRSAVIFYGIDNSNFSPLPWGSGSSYMCVKQPQQRTPAQNSGGTAGACNGSLALDWDAYQLTHPNALGNPWSAGAQVYVQAWYRDPPSAKSTHLSNAIQMTYLP